VPLPVRLLAVVFRVDLRVAAAEPVLLVLVRFAFPRLVADFRVALRLEAAADRLPPAERFALARLVLLSCAAAFVVPERFLRLRGFWVLPVMASVMLDTPSVIVSRMEVPFPSFSFSMLFTSLPMSAGKRHTESRQPTSCESRGKAV
jgi:hypothetical protein